MIIPKSLSINIGPYLPDGVNSNFPLHPYPSTPVDLDIALNIIHGNRNTDPAAHIYDLFAEGRMQQLLQRQSEEPCVTLVGRMTDWVINYFFGKSILSQETKRSLQNHAEEQKFHCENATLEEKLFELIPCETKDTNECFCHKFPVGCLTARVETKNEVQFFLNPADNYTIRSYALENGQEGCNLPEEKKEALLYAIKKNLILNLLVVLVEDSLCCNRGAEGNFSENFFISENKKASWKITILGERELNERYSQLFSSNLQVWLDDFYQMKSKRLTDAAKEANRQKKFVIMGSIASGGIIISALLASLKLYLRRLKQQQSTKELTTIVVKA